MIPKSWIHPWVTKYTTRGHQLYDGNVLAALSHRERGDFFSMVVREFYHNSINPTDHPSKAYKNSSARFSYDFLDAKTQSRIKVKSGKLVWIPATKKRSRFWELTFHDVDSTKFDKLLLIGFFPDIAVLWQWDGTTALSGRKIRFPIYRDEVSHKTFSARPGNILHSFSVDTLANEYSSKFTPSAKRCLYVNSPVISLSGSANGKMFENFAKEVWDEKFGTTSAPQSVFANGSFEYDFHDTTNDLRVEVKSASFCSYRNALFFYFSCIHISSFDRLLLVFNFPNKVEMYIWNGKTGLSSGKSKKYRADAVTFATKFIDGDYELLRCPGEQIFRRYFIE